VTQDIYPDFSRHHLGNSASSVHMKIRCPRCHNSFKTAGAVLEHLGEETPKCLDLPPIPNHDDIDKATWGRIERDVSREDFGLMPQKLQDEIDLWVMETLEDFTPPGVVERRQWELRKWNMVWRILFPDDKLPSSPCT